MYLSFMVHLHDCFSPSREVVPQFKSVALQGSRESIDIVAVLLVEVNRHPVFFMETNAPAALPYDSRSRRTEES